MDWWIDRGILHWENFRACETGERAHYLQQKSARWKKQFRWKQQQFWDRVRGRLALETFHQVRMMGFRANTAYDAKPYPGAVTLFRATEQPRGIYEDRTLGWGSVLNGQLEIIDTPGHHGAIVREPRSRVLAAQLTEVLRRVQRGMDSVDEPPDSGCEQNRPDENGNCASDGEHKAQLEIDFLSTAVRRAAAHRPAQ